MTPMLASTLGEARSQMAFTLGTHIILSCLGVGFPAIMLVANYLAVKNDDPDAMLLARRWSKVVAVTFAVGAVTGTVLSFEFGILWPGLFEKFGQIIGLPFAVEGIFFFLEAIFIAIYLYGWDRLSPWKHFWTGVPIVITGLGGATMVVSANAWMNQPGGFDISHSGKISNIDPWAAIFNKATPYEVPHMILAAYIVAGFLAASVYAVGMLRGRRDRYHRLGLTIPFVLAAIAVPIQLAVGDAAARAIATNQVSKYASMEYVTHSGSNVPEWIFGRYDSSNGDVNGGLRIPDLNSILVGFSPGTHETGLDTVPVKDRPPYPTMLHWCFDFMVFIGTGLMLLTLWFWWSLWRKRRPPENKWFLRAAAISGGLAIVALECGWIVTEVGRQPWIVYQILRTSDAVTHASGIGWSLAGVIVIYTAVAASAILVLRRMTTRWRASEPVGSPYGPDTPQQDEATA